jgi:hypothetical protein
MSYVNRASVEKVRNQYIRMLERYLSSQNLGVREEAVILLNQNIDLQIECSSQENRILYSYLIEI